VKAPAKPEDASEQTLVEIRDALREARDALRSRP
jgi:hypothetical protein